LSRRRRRGGAPKPPPTYEVEIPARTDVIAFLEQHPGPIAQKEIFSGLKVKGEAAREGMGNRLRAMVRDGELVVTKDGRYGITTEMNLTPGTVIAHPDGYAFIRPDHGDEDIFIPAKFARMALHGDRVAIRITRTDERGRMEGMIVKVLERANETIVGRFFREGGIGFVEPDNRRINQDVLIPQGKQGKAKPGDYVTVRITGQPDKRHQPIGEVVERIGTPTTPGMATEIAVRSHDIPDEWPQAVLAEAEALPTRVTPAAKRGRKDLRELAFVTIDGEDARDFDDAVYVEKARGGWTLWVAIADVSHYVRPGSALDDEAVVRGNSVYFPNRVIPMLPEALSNGLCSLNPKVDRLAMVAEMKLGPRGAYKSSTFYPAVIRSHARLTYDQVQHYLDGGKEPLIDRRLAGPIDRLHALYELLVKRREQRGALEIESTDTYVILNDEDQIEDIRPRQRFDAHKLIEEFMILANVAAAEFVTMKGKPALFRVHERPDEEKVLDLKVLLSSLGLTLGGGETPKPKDFSKVLKAAQARPEGHLIQTAVLRTMMMAVYSPKNEGHFGLALEAYAHFTSPIRRYPDLVLHRAIKAALGQTEHLDPEPEFEDMKRLGESCSATERRADEATRDALARMKCEYMADRVGEEYEGRITSVTAFGLFVELDDVYVEGLVHVTSLPRDYYEHRGELHQLVGRSSGKVYRLGDAIDVKVARVDVEEKKIDFMLAEGHVPKSNDDHRRGDDAADTGRGARKASAGGRKARGERGQAPAPKADSKFKGKGGAWRNR